jgi:hypothetical protein
MAIMERDGNHPGDAEHIIGAMVNRAKKGGVDLGDHVSQRVYQPTFEPGQHARLGKILKSPDFPTLSKFAQDRWGGSAPDNVDGATHYLAKPDVMVRLSGGVREDGRGGYLGNSRKYHSWPQWTGYSPTTHQYKNQTLTDNSHAFLAPEGRYSAPFSGAPQPANVAMDAPPLMQALHDDAASPAKLAQSPFVPDDKPKLYASSDPVLQAIGDSRPEEIKAREEATSPFVADANLPPELGADKPPVMASASPAPAAPFEAPAPAMAMAEAPAPALASLGAPPAAGGGNPMGALAGLFGGLAGRGEQDQGPQVDEKSMEAQRQQDPTIKAQKARAQSPFATDMMGLPESVKDRLRRREHGLA